MKIIIEFTSWFKRYTGNVSVMELEVPDSSTAADVLAAAGIPDEEIGFIVLNGRKIDNTFILSDKDRIKVYPYIIGG